MRVSGDAIVHIAVIANTIAFVINSMVNVNVQKAIQVIDVSWNVQTIDMV